MSLGRSSLIVGLVLACGLATAWSAEEKKPAEPTLVDRLKKAGLADKPFTLVVEFTVKPESAATLDPIVKRGATETHKEPGCLLYDAHKSAETPGKYIFLERFNGIAALEAHVATDYTKELLAAFAAAATEPPSIKIVDQISPQRK